MMLDSSKEQAPSWKTLQSSWLIAELPSKRMEVERNINIAINLFLSIG